MIYGLKEEAELQKGLSLYPLHDEFVKRESSAQKMIATESVLYIMGLDKIIQAVKADNITEVIGQTEKLEALGESKGEAQCFAICEARNELYIGDNKGFAHIYDLTSFTPKEEAPIKTHSKTACLSICVSHDNTKFALGDANGYVTVCDMESRAQQCYIYGHKSKVYQCQFTEDD